MENVKEKTAGGKSISSYKEIFNDFIYNRGSDFASQIRETLHNIIFEFTQGEASYADGTDVLILQELYCFFGQREFRQLKKAINKSSAKSRAAAKATNETK